MTLDAKLRWRALVKKQREELGLKYKKLHWLMGRRTTLSIHNKLTLYKQTLKPVWTCDIQLWRCTKQSNTDIIRRFQNTVDAPLYIINTDHHRDLQMEMVTNEIGKFAKKHEKRLLHHVNVEAIQLLDNSELVRRLKRRKTFELV